MGLIGLQIDGNDESGVIAGHHALKVLPPASTDGAGYIARLIAVQETVRLTRHVIIDPATGLHLAAPGLRLAWHYQTVKEDRGYVPGTGDPRFPFAVLHLPVQAAAGIQLDAQTINGDPAYHLFWTGTFQGKKVVSEVGYFGMIGDHVTLDGVWALEPISGGTGSPPAVPTGTREALASLIERLSATSGKTNALAYELEQEVNALRAIYARLP